MDCVDRSVIGEERRLMEEIEPQMTKIFKEFTGGSKVWLTTDFFKKVYREMYLAQLVIVGLYEVNADLNESLRLAAEANKDLDAKAENLAYKLGCLLCHATGGRLSKHTYDLLTMEKVVTDYLDETYREGKEDGYKNAKAEVAREIFTEIERLMLDGEIGGKYPAKVINPDKYAELKKKYTEETP
jgi:hypothetical protein